MLGWSGLGSARRSSPLPRPAARWGLGLAVGLVLSLAACEFGGSSPPGASGPMALNLTYLPSNEPDRSKTVGVAPLPAGTQVWINSITDARTEPNGIGFSAEGNDTPVVLHESSQPPTEFVRSVLARELPAFGLPVATEESAATHTLDLQLLKFWVHEGGTYVGEVMVSATLVDREGAVLWQAQLSGSDKHWGKTFTQENFLNTYGNATLSLSEKLALDPGLRAGISTGQAQPPAATGDAAQPAASQP